MIYSDEKDAQKILPETCLNKRNENELKLLYTCRCEESMLAGLLKCTYSVCVCVRLSFCSPSKKPASHLQQEEQWPIARLHKKWPECNFTASSKSGN